MSQTDDSQSEHPSGTTMDHARLLPYAELGLRLLGVMLFFDGVSLFIGGGVQALFTARAYDVQGYAYTLDPHSAGWIAQGIPYMLGGIYLMLSGRSLLRNVFMFVQNDEGTEKVGS